MKTKLVYAFACLPLLLSLPALAGDTPEIITVIYLNDGRVIECDMGWIEQDLLKYKKYGGILSLQLNTVDIQKTFEVSAKREKDWITEKASLKDRYDLKKSPRSSASQIDSRKDSCDVPIWIDATTCEFCEITLADLSVRFKTGRLACWEVAFSITNNAPCRMRVTVDLGGYDSHGYLVERKSVSVNLMGGETRSRNLTIRHKQTAHHYRIVKWEPFQLSRELTEGHEGFLRVTNMGYLYDLRHAESLTEDTIRFGDIDVCLTEVKDIKTLYHVEHVLDLAVRNNGPTANITVQVDAFDIRGRQLNIGTTINHFGLRKGGMNQVRDTIKISNNLSYIIDKFKVTTVFVKYIPTSG